MNPQARKNLLEAIHGESPLRNRAWIFIVMIASPVVGWGQGTMQTAGGDQPFTTIVAAPPSMTTAYGGWTGGGATVASANKNGIANVISARGEAALNSSAAAVNLTEAEANDIQNRQAATDTYFSMRAANRLATMAEAGGRLTLEQMTQIALQGVPKPLSRSQIDPDSGRLIWPVFLQTDPFNSRREEVDRLVAKEAYMGGLSYPDQSKVRELIKSMHLDLKAQINNVSTSDYIAARTFLNSLSWAITKFQI